MATLCIKTYQIYPGITYNDFINCVKQSIEIFYNDIKWIYIEGHNCIHSLSGFWPQTYSLPDLHSKISRDNKVLQFKSMENFDQEIVSVEEILDWPKMITDLEKMSLIKTLRSTDVLATDERKYYFEKGGPDTSISVDCLGTKLFAEESDAIKNLWLLFCSDKSS